MYTKSPLWLYGEHFKLTFIQKCVWAYERHLKCWHKSGDNILLLVIYYTSQREWHVFYYSITCVCMCDDVPGPHTHKIDLIWFLVCKLSSLIFVQIKFYGQTTFERYYVVTVTAGLWVSILFFLWDCVWLLCYMYLYKTGIFTFFRGMCWNLVHSGVQAGYWSLTWFFSWSLCQCEYTCCNIVANYKLI